MQDDHPRICVQVKSQDSPIDTETLDRLIGTMQNVHAEQGLLVSWGGFKSSVDKQVPAQFFRVRFWDQNTLIEQLLEHYDKQWLQLIREHLVKNLTIELDDFDAPIFFQRGGLGKARKVFADDLSPMLKRINAALASV